MQLIKLGIRTASLIMHGVFSSPPSPPSGYKMTYEALSFNRRFPP